MSEEGLFALVKCRALEWSIAADYICTEKSKWWNSNPLGVITASLRLKEQFITVTNSELVDFIDGSYRSQIKSNISGGVGGLIKLQNGKKLLDFAGPSEASSAFEAEEFSLGRLLQILHDHLGNFSYITVFSDNQKLVKKFTQKVTEGADIGSYIVNVKYISRNLNMEEDALARKGLSLDTLLVNWA